MDITPTNMPPSSTDVRKSPLLVEPTNQVSLKKTFQFLATFISIRFITGIQNYLLKATRVIVVVSARYNIFEDIKKFRSELVDNYFPVIETSNNFSWTQSSLVVSLNRPIGWDRMRLMRAPVAALHPPHPWPIRDHSWVVRLFRVISQFGKIFFKLRSYIIVKHVTLF